MDALKGLSKEEILEILEHGFCADCQARLDTRIQNLVNANSTNGTELSPQIEPKRYGTTPETIEKKHTPFGHWGSDVLMKDVLRRATSEMDYETSEERQERIKFLQVGSKKDYVHFERVNGKSTNILQGLELHTRVFNEEEQKKIIDSVYALQRMGEKGQLRERTFSAPKKWMRGKGRVTLQFGCCYNYAVDRSGNPPGIVRDEDVDPLPPMFKEMIKRMVRWNILPATCIPNSCIVNIYDKGDCIPPHIDHHDFLRPFCTTSFLSECKILFGSSLKVVDAGEFSGPVSIPLPVGSVLILNGNGADVAKHCVPAVPARRISITFRRMDKSKIPHGYSPDPELLQIMPIFKSPSQKYSTPTRHTVSTPHNQKNQHQDNRPLHNEYDFPPLGVSPASRRSGSRVGQKK